MLKEKDIIKSLKWNRVAKNRWLYVIKMKIALNDISPFLKNKEDYDYPIIEYDWILDISLKKTNLQQSQAQNP